MSDNLDIATVIDRVADEYLKRAVGVLSRGVEENRIDSMYDSVMEASRTFEGFRALAALARGEEAEF